jgi:murein DD-endopeptidase MepM/ murein hydrolase activator NlpD
MILSLALILLQAAAASAKPPIIIPPKAAPVTGEIDQVTLGPIALEPFACTEHPLGQLSYAGDALGTDCTIVGGITDRGGFPREFKTDGKTNDDWYGWKVTLLAPFDGVVVGAYAKDEVNTPGVFGKPPAAVLQFRRADGVIVVYAHVTDLMVKVGDRVTAGQPVAKVGNNGVARSPHTHVGAWREKDSVPLQIRWDLRAMARLQGQ